MSNLKLSKSVEFGNYKGFIIKVTPLDDTFSEFAGVAINEEHTAKFVATAKTRNECGRQLERYIDVYRKTEKQKLIIN